MLRQAREEAGLTQKGSRRQAEHLCRQGREFREPGARRAAHREGDAGIYRVKDGETQG